MAKLAIQGHATRGREVIELLEMLGGKNEASFEGFNTACWYFLGKDNLIGACTEFVNDVYATYTLEEFLAQFPYKLYDKVRLTNIDVVQITNAYWDSVSEQVIYEGVSTLTGQEYDSLNAKNLRPYAEQLKEKDMEETEWVNEIDCPDGYEFRDEQGNVIHATKIVLKKKPQYPKTYEECSGILGTYTDPDIEGYKHELLWAFQKLLICRDAYWKLAGDWKPDWADEEKPHYTIVCSKLDFPTAGMRDAFYENFKDLIEECKELL